MPVTTILPTISSNARSTAAANCDAYIEISTLKKLAGEESLNMTRLALNLSEYVNGVAKRHARNLAQKMYPGYRLHAITNGVHPFTWVTPGLRELYDRHLPGWCHEPELLLRAEDFIPEGAVWRGAQGGKAEP